MSVASDAPMSSSQQGEASAATRAFPEPDWMRDLVATGDYEIRDLWADYVNAGVFAPPLRTRPWNDDAHAENKILVRYFVDKATTPTAGSPRKVLAAVWFNHACAGPPPDITHGGAVASAMDDVLGTANFLNGLVGFTINLTTKYRRPIVLEPGLGRVVKAVMEIPRAEGRKLFCSGTMSDGDTGEVLATADGIFLTHSADGKKVDLDFDFPVFRSYMMQLDDSRNRAHFPMQALPLRVPPSVVQQVLDENPGYAVYEQLLLPKKGDITHYIGQNPKLDTICFRNDDTGDFFVVVAASAEVQGPPGSVHGGCIAALHDHSMAYWFLTTGKLAMTVELSVDYKALTPLEDFYIIDVVQGPPPQERSERRIQVISTMKGLDRKTVHSTARSLWTLPKGHEMKLDSKL
eukprot:TRINITY_DN10686_c0_g1_i4.p1 TRINITY_DN10686_c0_g1~~TRINITY_DN10686_c0_g1_i4.p1  ORF type:complete len:405 (-),score=71.23 TRINITY_DN10686_c0_g1_i4:383-1597(-)